jgi:hypothetical protein
MFLDDDLPIWGFVGKLERTHAHGLKDGLAGEAHTYLFTHFHFDIAYNGDQVLLKGGRVWGKGGLVSGGLGGWACRSLQQRPGLGGFGGAPFGGMRGFRGK